MSVHYKYGGSVLERIGICAGSAKAGQENPDQPAGAAADRGTRIHSRVEQLFADPDDKQFLKDDEEFIARAVVIKIIALASELGFTKADLVLEQQFAATQFHPTDAGGTPDVYAVRSFGDLLVIDLKTGARFVGAEKNIQLAFYAACVLQNVKVFGLQNAHLMIVQPEQTEPYNVVVRKWSLTIPELKAFIAEQIKPIIDRAEANPDERTPGDHCVDKWCPVRGNCKARMDWMNEQSAGKFYEALRDVRNVPDENVVLAQQLKVLKSIRDWCDEREKTAKVKLQAGEVIPDYGLVDTMSNRAWVDKEKAAAFARVIGLKEDDFMPQKPRELVSPAQFEELCKKADIHTDITTYTERHSTGSKLVAADKGGLAELQAKLFDAVAEA